MRFLAFITLALCLLSCTEEADSQKNETRLNVNTATISELDQLPQIGETLAERIIDGRPYGHVNDLLEVSGLGEGKLANIRDLVSVVD